MIAFSAGNPKVIFILTTVASLNYAFSDAYNWQ